MKLETATSLPSPAMPPAAMGSFLSDVSLRLCVEPGEIDQVRYLREGIDLSTHTATPEGEREFRRLEKKETSAALHFRSSLMARRSAPSGSCHWACN